MKNNKLFYVMILLLGACSKKHPETLLSKWEKKAVVENVLERSLASDANGKCMINIFNTQTLKDEVRELEKQFAGAQKVAGTWRHINLERLPVPQANFLKTYGKEIGDLKSPDSIDYSSCLDLPCIFNKIYGKDEDVAGYVHYIWYLKFGHMLSLDNKVPEQISPQPGIHKTKTFPLSAYLYNEDELYGFWRTSHMLKSPHTTLKGIKEIQRIPRGELFEGKEYEGACGLAYSGNGGSIRMTDGCLSIDKTDKDSGYFYLALIHELSHIVDFEQARGSRLAWRSNKDDYMAISGFTLKEYVDEYQQPVRKWEVKAGTKLITEYAGQSPQENFAETIAHYRVNGDSTKSKISPEHYSFMATDYFHDKGFRKEDLLKSWIQDYSSESARAVFKSVVECGKNAGAPKTQYFTAKDFSVPVLPSMLNCLGYNAQQISLEIKSKTSLYKPDGCNTYKDFSMKRNWDDFMKEHLQALYEKYLVELKNDKQYLARIDKFYKQISDKTIAKLSYLNCYKQSYEESCYKDELLRNAYDNAMVLNLPEVQTKELADMYVSYHSFDGIKNDTLKSYQVFVLGHLESIRASAQDLWEGCLDLPHNDDQPPVNGLFQVGSGYMVSSMYNCLNTNIPTSIKDAVRNITVDGEQVKHAKEEIILAEEVQPHFLNILKDIYSTRKDKEITQANLLMAQDNGKIRSDLLSNFSWVRNVVDSKLIIAECKKQAAKIIPMKPLFNLKLDLFGDYFEKNSCLNISTSPEFTSWLESSSGQMEDKVTSSLEEKVLELGYGRANECLETYPMNSVINKIRYRKSREDCLLFEWSNLEAKVLAQASADPLIIKFKMTTDDLKSRLEAGRRKIQLKIIKEKFQ